MKKSQLQENAQALVEFALLVFVLMVMMVGVLDLGRVTYDFSAVYNAAREGARYGAVHPNNGALICTKAQPISIGMTLACNPLDTKNKDSCNGNEICAIRGIDTTDPDNPYTYIEVTVVYQYEPVTPLVIQAFGISTLPLTSTSRMVIEGVQVN